MGAKTLKGDSLIHSPKMSPKMAIYPVTSERPKKIRPASKKLEGEGETPSKRMIIPARSETRARGNLQFIFEILAIL
jgi:hypothetical protein